MHVQKMAGHMIRRLHQTSTQTFTNHMQKAGFDLTSVQFAAMDAIGDNPGIDQAGIAELIAFDRATIGGVIDRLEKKGLIVRKISKLDRRAREIRLSKEGESLFKTLLPLVTELQTDILCGLDEAEKKEFLRLISKAVGFNK